MNEKQFKEMLQGADYSQLKNHVSFRVTNKRNLKTNSPYKHLVGDIVAQLVITVSNEHTAISAQPTRKYLESLGVDYATILYDAMENTPDDYEIYSFGDYMESLRKGKLYKKYPLTDKGTNNIVYSDNEIYNVYVVASKHMVDVTVFMHKHRLDILHDLVGDYYIIPSSKFEVLIVPKCTEIGKSNIKELKSMILCVNTTAVEDKDILSNHLFEYDGTQLKQV
jgi:hypothetical protein